MKVSKLLKITIEHHLRKPGGTITQDSSRFLCVAAGYAASSALRRAAYGRLKGHIDASLGLARSLEEWLYRRRLIPSPDLVNLTPELAAAVQEHRIAWATKMMEEFAARGD